MEGELSTIGGDGDASGRVEPDGSVSDPFIRALGINHAYNALLGYRGLPGKPHGEENHQAEKRNVPSEHSFLRRKHTSPLYTAAWSDSMERRC
jgi:hypothetical protein